MEECIEYNEDPLFSNDKARLCCVQSYYQYYIAIEYTLDKTPSNLELADFDNFLVGTQIYNHKLKTLLLLTYTKNKFKDNSRKKVSF